MLSLTSTGSYSKTESFLQNLMKMDVMAILNKYGHEGVIALSRATPVDTGRAASSWGYEVARKGSVYTITWTNSDIEDGYPVVIMIQYGHGTGTGGYIQGIDFINPAIRPIFDRIVEDVWKVVTSA